MARDFEFIRSCDAIHLLPGWEHSSGAKREPAFAVSLDKSIGFWGVKC